MARRHYRIAVIPGDGIGKEVVPEGIRVLEAAASRFGFTVEQQWHDFACCDYYPPRRDDARVDWRLHRSPDAIFFGAVGWPDTVRTMCPCGARCSSSAGNTTSTSICARCG